MIATQQFVFLHLHKSAGTFVNECLLCHCPEAIRIGYHLPRRLIPARFAQRPVLATVRNPWSYYVSWYAFQSARPRPNALFTVLSDHGRLGFDGTIRNMLELGNGSACLDALLAVLPARYGDRGLNLPGCALEPIRASGLGFYSYLHDYMLGTDTVQVARMEYLREELLAAMIAAGVPVDSALASRVRSAPRLNTSRHRDYADYYDAALRDLVARRDRTLIERYAYRFGD